MELFDDSSILSVIADRAESPGAEPGEFTDLIAKLKDQDAKRVADILIRKADPSRQDSPKVKRAVEGFRGWVNRNRTLHSAPKRRSSVR